MIRAVATIAFIFIASHANAKNCPDFFRFVDFGIKSNDGDIHPRGVVFRAEGFDGQSLILEDRTQCLTVREISKDGHGNPIPIVKSVEYNPERTGIDLIKLSISVSADLKADAEKNARAHRARLEQNGFIQTRGPNFLCLSENSINSLSCQLTSPYPGNYALVVYCNERECTIPVLAAGKEISVSVAWASSETFVNNPEAAGTDIYNKVLKIQDFLNPLTSTL